MLQLYAHKVNQDTLQKRKEELTKWAVDEEHRLLKLVEDLAVVKMNEQIEKGMVPKTPL